MLTMNTQIPVATFFPLPVFFIRKAMRRSNAGARLTDSANLGTLVNMHIHQARARGGGGGGL